LAALQINDRYEFPDELDLDVGEGKYLSENADRSVRNLYKLHSVLVHSGGVHGGHYYAFIQPDGKQWLKFDDERVRARAAPLFAQLLQACREACSARGVPPAVLTSKRENRPSPGCMHGRVLWVSHCVQAWQLTEATVCAGQVSNEDAKKALNEQYGGEDENSPPGTGFNTFRFTKYSNAYMLVYVRKSDWDQVCCLPCVIPSKGCFMHIQQVG
jgi:hypothetical protein